MKDLLLVAGGVALGYLIFTKDLFKRAKQGTKDILSGAEEGVKDLVNPKQSECEKKWSEEIGQISRFATKEAMELSKSSYVKECMSNK